MDNKKFPTRKRNRLENFDYSQGGSYFVTICAKQHQCIFGNMNVDFSKSQYGEATVVLTDVGKIIEKEILNIEQYYNNMVWIEMYVVMPNHLHFILNSNGGYLEKGQWLSSFPTVSKIVKHLKEVITKQVGYSVWQKSYYDHIIRNEKDYREICKYIDNNPQKWALDKYFREW